MKFFGTLVVGLGLLGCTMRSSLKPGMVRNSFTEYGIELPKAGWKVRHFRGAEIFLEHEATHATVFFNSECQKVSDSPLEALTAQALVGFTDINYLTQKRLDVADRVALVSEIEARVDGVLRFLDIAVLRKNTCVYDAVLSSNQKNDELIGDFEAMLKTMWAVAKL